MNISTPDGTDLFTLYDKLLQKYWNILNESEINPYAPLGKQVLYQLRPKYCRHLMISVRKFLNIPNALQQELIGCADLMSEAKSLSDGELDSILTMNDINLERLHRRYIVKWIKPAVLISVISALISEILKVIPIVETIGSSTATFALAYFVAIIVLTVLFNFLILFPKIGFVRAFGDILKIEKARRRQ